MKLFAGMVVLTALLLAGTGAGQYLEERLRLTSYEGENGFFELVDRDGWNSPSTFELRIEEEQYVDATLKAPNRIVFTSGDLKEEADRALSKVFDGYDTQWGKRFVYNEPSFVGNITFVEARSREIGVHLQISKSDYDIATNYHDGQVERPPYSIISTLKKPDQTSNTGTPGEHVFVLSSRNETLFFGPPSPAPYARYYEVKSPESPLKDAISPSHDGLDLRVFGVELLGERKGERDGATYYESMIFGIPAETVYRLGNPSGYTSRSTSDEDMEYVKSLTSKISTSYSPVQATFIHHFSLADRFRTGFDVDLQMIVSVDASGRPAMILNVAKNRPTSNPADFVIKYFYDLYFPSDGSRGFRHQRDLNLGRDFDRKSNINQEGIWVFVLKEDGTDFLGADMTTDVQTPSLYKFCSQDSVDVLVEAEELTKSSFVNLEKLGWTGKWRKKSLRYLANWGYGTRLSHQRGATLAKLGRRYKTVNYRMGLWESTGESTLQRLCLVSDSSAMEQVARDTKKAGLDASMSPEIALVLEYEVVQRNIPAGPKFIMEHVFASFPGRETIAVIANVPPAPAVNLEVSTSSHTQCGASRSISKLSSGSSNTDVEGRFVVVYDGSRELGSVQPDGVQVKTEDGDCDDYAAPCDGECPAGYSCQVHGSKTLCVNCGNFIRADKYARLETCCKLNPRTNRCLNRFSHLDDKCTAENPDYFRVIDGRPMVFPVDTETVCNSPRHFKRNGGACVLKDTFKRNGNRKCHFQYKRAV